MRNLLYLLSILLVCNLVSASDELPNIDDILASQEQATTYSLTAEEKENLDVDGLVRRIQQLEKENIENKKKSEAEKQILLQYIAKMEGKDGDLSDVNKMLLSRKDPMLDSLLRNPNGKYVIDPQSGALVLMKTKWRYTVTPGGSVVMDCVYNDGVYIPQTIYVGADRARKLMKGEDQEPVQPPGSVLNFGR